MYRLELKKRNKKIDKSAKGSYKYITRSELSNKDMVKSTDIEYTFSKVPKIFEEKESNFWSSVDKNERKNGRVNSELLISIPREFDKEERIKLVDNLIKEILDKNTPYSYAIHNPIASDGLNNPHCHLMIYEKNFNRAFFKENFIDDIDNKYFKGTFRKDENYIKKNLNYEKKSFIYDSREKFEEQLLIMSKSNTKEEIINSLEITKKDNEYNYKSKEVKLTPRDYEQFLKSEQVLMEKMRGEYMEEFKSISEQDDTLKNLKEMIDNLDEKDFEKMMLLFSKETQFFKDIKNLDEKALKEKKYDDTVKEVLSGIIDIKAINNSETLISKESDLLKIDKNIRESTDKKDITDRYIYDEILTQIFKGRDEHKLENENVANVLDLDIPRYNELNFFFQNMIEDFKLKPQNYIFETKIDISTNEEDNSKEIKCKQIDKEKHEVDCIKLEEKFNQKENEFFSKDVLRNQLRLFYYEFLNNANDSEENTMPGYTEFYENLETNVANEYMELTKSFVYTNLFYKIENNYFATKNDDNTKTENIDFDYLNPISKKENLHTKTFVPDLSKKINENVLELLDSEETEHKKIGDNTIYKTSQRIEYVNKIKSILEINVKYLNQDTEFYKSNIFNQALKDRDEILRDKFSIDENNEDKREKINFKVSIKIKGKEEEKSYQEYVKDIINQDKKNLKKNISGTFTEMGSITDKENFSDVMIKDNLIPNLPLIKVKKYLIKDINYGNMRDFKLGKIDDLIDFGKQKETYYQYKLKKNIFKSPSVLENSYNKAMEIQKNVNINKDINHLILLSLEKTKEDRTVLSNIKLEKAKKYNLVDLKEVESFIGKVDKNNALKVSKNISNKVYDKNFIHKELAKEFDTKKRINNKVREKGALSYMGYSDDIEKINHTIREIEYREKRRVKNRIKVFTDVNEMLKFNSVGLNENENNLETIGKFFNWNAIRGYKISEAIKNMNAENFDIIATDKKLKSENDNIKNFIFTTYIDKKDKVSIPDNMKKADIKKEELFFYKKKEILAFQLEIATKNISIANIGSSNDSQTLSEIDSLSKKSLAYMKKTMEKGEIDKSKTEDILEIEKRVDKYESNNKKKIEDRGRIEREYYDNISLSNLTKYVKEKKMLVISLEWEQTQITDEKIQEKSNAISFKGEDLYKYNKDIFFNNPAMETEKLYFKLFVKEENSNNKRIINLNSYNNSISEDDEKTDKIVEEKIISKYFSDKGYSKPKETQNWEEDEKFDLEKRLDKNSKYWKERKESITNDTSLLEVTKRLVANSTNFQNILYGMEKTISFETSLGKLEETNLGGLFVGQIQDYVIQETEYKKEIYKFKNQAIQEHLEVEGIVDDELKLKRKVKEISYFSERKELLTQTYNLGFLENKNGEVSLKNDSSSSGKKVNKKISFTQESDKINTNIETLPIVPLDVKKKIKKKNMTIVKNNSEYLNTLKEIEMSI